MKKLFEILCYFSDSIDLIDQLFFLKKSIKIKKNCQNHMFKLESTDLSLAQQI